MWRVLLPLLLLPVQAIADVSLALWQPEGFPYAYLLAVRDGEPGEAALARYLGALEAEPRLRSFAASLRAAGAGRFHPFAPAREPIVLAVANDPVDLTAAPRRMQRVLGPLADRGAKPLVAPVAVTAGLTEAEKAEFHAHVAGNVDLLLSVGGDDIAPALYGQPNRHARHVNPARDAEELRLVRAYMEEGKGFFVGICRGSQMAGVAAGCTLIQDIQAELGASHPVHVNHPIRMKPDAAGEVTRKLFAGADTLEVNSIHHQAVRSDGPHVRVTAVSGDRAAVVEISEYFNGRGLGVQFHPELLADQPFHARFYDVLYDEAAKARDGRLVRGRAFPRLADPEFCRHAYQVF